MQRGKLQEEVEFVKSHQDVQEGEDMHLIDAGWWHRWSIYATAHKAGVSDSGPGPINNWQLLDASAGYSTPEQGLVADFHYKAVTGPVWELLKSRYGGGPDITNKVLDIYSATIHLHDGPSRGVQESNKPSSSRFAMEIKYVQSNDVPAQGELWCLIDAAWLQRWNKYTKEGGPPPGPISNWQLLHEAAAGIVCPKADLEVNKHYKGLSASAWNFLEDRYGGEPRITGKELNIYSADDLMTSLCVDDGVSSPGSPSCASEGGASSSSASSFRSFFKRHRLAGFKCSLPWSGSRSHEAPGAVGPPSSTTSCSKPMLPKEKPAQGYNNKLFADTKKRGQMAQQRRCGGGENGRRAQPRKRSTLPGAMDGVLQVLRAGRKKAEKA